MQPIIPIDVVSAELHSLLARLHDLVTSWLPEYLAEHRSDICAAFLRFPGNGRLIFESESTAAEAFAVFRAAEPEHFVEQCSRAQAIKLGLQPSHSDPRECRLLIVKFNKARRLKGLPFLNLGPRLDHLALSATGSLTDATVERDQFKLNEASEELHAARGVSASRRDNMQSDTNRSGISASRAAGHLTIADLTALDESTPEFSEDRPPGDPADASAPATRPSRMLPPTAKNEA